MTSPPSHTWIRYAGRVWEDLSFEAEAGWQTDTVARRPPRGDGTWVLELLDERGVVIVDTWPAVAFTASGGRMQSARVVAYLPAHPAGRSIRLRRRDFVVDTRTLTAASPEVRITEVEVTEDRHLRIAWEASHADPHGPPLSYRVVYIAPGRGVFPIARDLTATVLLVPVARLPGSLEGRFAVLATDGLRSGRAVSRPVRVPMHPARVAILEPRPALAWPADQPLTLRGVAHDDAGRRLDPVGLVWTLDGEPVAREQHLALLRDLRPGDHTLVLAWEGAGAPRAETRVQFKVTRRELPAPPEPVAPEPEPHRPTPTVAPQTTATLRLKL
ncbi:MAG: hypothetical protein H6733_01960 [Alphaproteobacteria bacterium]|nr:hypothetical protein [Alphaproteobacteria bacterium]